MKKLTTLLSIIILIVNQSYDNSDEVIDLEGNRLFGFQFIDAGILGKINEKRDLVFTEFIELSFDNHFVKRRVYPDSTGIVKGSYLLIQSVRLEVL